ncbi:hypothetical protein [Pseudoalteromonas phage PH357]|nr:hypothetical protein [Pseudoalteromonas phage PH357]
MERCFERGLGTWDEIVNLLKDIPAPKKGYHKVFVDGKCFITDGCVLVTCFPMEESDAAVDGYLVVNCE